MIYKSILCIWSVLRKCSRRHHSMYHLASVLQRWWAFWVLTHKNYHRRKSVSKRTFCLQRPAFTFCKHVCFVSYLLWWWYSQKTEEEWFVIVHNCCLGEAYLEVMLLGTHAKVTVEMGMRSQSFNIEVDWYINRQVSQHPSVPITTCILILTRDSLIPHSCFDYSHAWCGVKSQIISHHSRCIKRTQTFEDKIISIRQDESPYISSGTSNKWRFLVRLYRLCHTRLRTGEFCPNPRASISRGTRWNADAKTGKRRREEDYNSPVDQGTAKLLRNRIQIHS